MNQFNIFAFIAELRRLLWITVAAALVVGVVVLANQAGGVITAVLALMTLTLAGRLLAMAARHRSPNQQGIPSHFNQSHPRSGTRVQDASGNMPVGLRSNHNTPLVDDNKITYSEPQSTVERKPQNSSGNQTAQQGQSPQPRPGTNNAPQGQSPQPRPGTNNAPQGQSSQPRPGTNNAPQGQSSHTGQPGNGSSDPEAGRAGFPNI